MELLLTVLAVISILFGLGLFFSTARGAFLASVIAIGAGIYAYDTRSFTALFLGFALLWLLRIIGIEDQQG